MFSKKNKIKFIHTIIYSILSMSMMVNASDLSSNPNSSTENVINNIESVKIHSGVDGVNARTLTVIQAEKECSKTINYESNLSGDSSSANSKRSIYDTCMASYAPFLIGASSGGVDCLSPTLLKWGGEVAGSPSCEGFGKSSINNELISVSNNKSSSKFQGYAQFQCIEGNLKFIKGSCTKLPAPCEAGQIIKWPITTPDWASSEGNPSNPKYDPQPDCAVVMPKALSGQVISAKPTVADPSNPKSATKVPFSDWYQVSQSSAVARCWDGEWLVESSNCAYQPGNCAATKYTTADGCEFNLPSFGHNTNILVNKPIPINSVGSVEAFCWNGDIEIIAESCKLSCKDNFTSKSWASDSTDNGMCSHGNISLATRTAPDSSYTISNSNSTHSGSKTYKCDDGFWKDEGQSCQPINCVGKPAGSWTVAGKTCNHNEIKDVVPHGQSIVTFSNNLPLLVGQKEYICNYGTWINGSSESCVDVIATCKGDATPPVGSTTVNVPSWGSGCLAQCTITSGGVMSCFDSCSSAPSCNCHSPCGKTNETICNGSTEQICSAGSWKPLSSGNSLSGTCSL